VNRVGEKRACSKPSHIGSKFLFFERKEEKQKQKGRQAKFNRDSREAVKSEKRAEEGTGSNGSRLKESAYWPGGGEAKLARL